MIIKIILVIIGLILVIFSILLPKHNEWTYIKCLEECNQDNNVPHSSCNYPMVQKLIDHGKCWWSDMTPLNQFSSVFLPFS